MPGHPAPDGRWQRGKQVAGLYLAEDPDTVWAEWYRALAEPTVGEKRSHLHPTCTRDDRRGVRGPPFGRTKSACVQANPQWAIQDSNLGPLPYQRSALTD